VHANGRVEVLAPTAPLIGVFDDQHHLFAQEAIPISAGSVLVATTDGVTESRNADGETFGMDRFIASVKANLQDDLRKTIAAVVDEALAFGRNRQADDIAILAARIL
jgi:sigma-B regulation protein RsbU (phosphoserine phosphatase)